MNNKVSQITDAILQTPYEFQVKNDKTGDVRKFSIKPVCLGCLLAVSKEVSKIDFTKVLESKNPMELVELHADTMLRIVSMVIHNSNLYTNETYEFLKDNLNSMEMYELLTETLVRIDTTHFQKSIILAKKMSLLSEELIASHLMSGN
jgi:hypothetical protein